MTKQELYRFTSQCYKRLKDKEFTVRFFRKPGYHGLCHFTNLIEINPHGEVLGTLVHEMLHDIYPDWTEEMVEAKERLIMHQLSHRQMANLIVAFGESLRRAHP